MSQAKSLDPRDHQILALLQSNSRIPISELATKVTLSATAVRQRITRMEKDKVILGYTLNVQQPHTSEQCSGLMSLHPHNPSHPGKLIYRTYIEPFHHITSAGVARELGINKSTLGRLLSGQIDITSDMAVKLSAVLGRSAESWLRLQEQFNLWQSRQTIDLSSFSKMTFSKPVNASPTAIEIG